jgi:hypothetical protein
LVVTVSPPSPPFRRPTFQKITKSGRITKLAKQFMSTCTAKKLCYRQPNALKSPTSAATSLTRMEAEDSQFMPSTSQAQLKIQQILGPPFIFQSGSTKNGSTITIDQPSVAPPPPPPPANPSPPPALSPISDAEPIPTDMEEIMDYLAEFN